MHAELRISETDAVLSPLRRCDLNCRSASDDLRLFLLRHPSNFYSIFYAS